MCDSDLISSILKGDTQEYKYLVDKYKGIVFRLALGYSHNKQDAEDITQEVFIKCFQGLGTFKGESSFSTWICRITINTSLTHIKKSSRFNFLSFSDKKSDPTHTIETNQKTPEELFSDNQANIAIRKILDTLPSNQKTAFILSKYEDMSQKDISLIMCISEGAVEQLLYRAKQHLSKKIENINNGRRKNKKPKSN